MKNLIIFILAIIVIQDVAQAQLLNWTNDNQVRPKPDRIAVINRLNAPPFYILTDWSAGELYVQYQGTQSKVKILLPLGVTNVMMSAQSNTFQNGPDMLTQWPVFGLFNRWDIGLFCNSWEPTDCSGIFVCKNDMTMGNNTRTVSFTEPNDTLRWIAYTQHNPATGISSFSYGSNGSLTYTISDTLLFNAWVDGGKPLPENCTNFNVGVISGNQTVCEGMQGSATGIVVTAAGYGSSIYSWEYRTDLTCDACWILIPGETSATLTPPIMPEGTYEVRRNTLNACGYGHSNILTMTVESCTGVSNQYISSPQILQTEFNTIQISGLTNDYISLVDIAGRVIINSYSECNGDFLITPEFRLQGIYLLTIKNDYRVITRKVFFN